MRAETMRRYYSIGGVGFAVEADRFFSDGEPYSLFSLPCPTEDDVTVFSAVHAKALPSPRGEMIYEGTNRRVYRDENGDITLYFGFYSNGRVTDREIGMMKYFTGNERNVRILLSDEGGRLPDNSAMLFKVLFLEHLLLLNRGVILHSSYIVTRYGAVLFTAPSGTGKSTQAELWQRLKGAETVNGDCSVIRKENGVYKAFGLPFSGSSGICFNRTCPIAAVVALGQAKENRLKRLFGAEAFVRIFGGVKRDTWDFAGTEMCSAVLGELCAEIPVFSLDCLPDSSAVELLDRELSRCYDIKESRKEETP